MWPDLIQKAKDGGLDVIQTYVFWNGHEPSPGQVRRSPKLSQPSRRRLLPLPTVCLNLLLFLIFGSIILVVITTWFASSSWWSRPASMFISGLVLMFVPNGTLGTRSRSSINSSMWNQKPNHAIWRCCSVVHLVFVKQGISCLAKICSWHHFQERQWTFQGKNPQELLFTCLYSISSNRAIANWSIHVKGGHGEVHREDCRHDEVWTIIRITGWSHYPLSGIIESFPSLLSSIR